MGSVQLNVALVSDLVTCNPEGALAWRRDVIVEIGEVELVAPRVAVMATVYCVSCVVFARLHTRVSEGVLVHVSTMAPPVLRATTEYEVIGFHAAVVGALHVTRIPAPQP